MARGRHSQLILVLPKLDIVAVMTGVLRDDEFYSVSRFIDDITKTVKSDQPLPADPIAKALLDAAVRRAATDQPIAIASISELASEISGKSFQLENNALHVKSFSLNFYDTDSSWVITTSTERSDRPTERFAGLMGLDGTFRKSPPALYGINACRARWLNQHTFFLERRILGHSEIQSWTLAFDGGKVNIAFENTDGAKFELHGEMQD
jgi:hypothetical protein